MHGFTFWLALAALTVYTAVVAAGGFLAGRLMRTGRRAEQVFRAEMDRLGRLGGAERLPTHRAYELPAIPDLGDILSHRAKGRRP